MVSDRLPSEVLAELRAAVHAALGPTPTQDDYWTMAFYLEVLAREVDELGGPETGEVAPRPDTARLVEAVLRGDHRPPRRPPSA